MKKIIIALSAACFIGCKNGDKKQIPTVENNTNTEQTSSTPSSQQETVSADDGTVSFKVNDTLARTKKTTKDTDEHLGMYTEATKFFTLSLIGDVPGRPHRGWLNFSIKDFKFEPASYTVYKENNASFSRYETENAGGSTRFEASTDERYKGTSLTITFIKVEKVPNEIGGTEHRVSGTFSGKLQDKVIEMKRTGTAQELNITEGSFENIRLVGGPK